MDLSLPQVDAIAMKEQDGEQIKGDVNLIDETEEQTLESWTSCAEGDRRDVHIRTRNSEMPTRTDDWCTTG